MRLSNYICGNWVLGKGEEIPVLDSVTGQVVAISDTSGLDLGLATDYARTVGYKNLSALTFYDRGQLLKKIALYLLERKQKYYELSYRTGATKVDSWVDIEGGFGTFFTYSGLAKRMLPNTTFWVEPSVEKLSAEGSHLGLHILTPSEGVSVQINAYNFPVWGMMEKLSTSLLAGVPSIVKPATPGCYLTHAVFQDIIGSGLLPEGAIQLVCGDPGNLLEYVQDGDSVLFTGSASTGRKLKSMPNIAGSTVRFNMEADSLNCSILGPDAKVGTPEFDLFIREVRNEITTKAGQKCTAIRRILVPENHVEAVQKALSSALDQVSIGNPLKKQTRMGAIAGKEQLATLKEKIQLLAGGSELVYEGKHQLIDADFSKGSFITPRLFFNPRPLEVDISHETEAFGPVATIMPYTDAEQAVNIARKGKGSLVASVVSNNTTFASEVAWRLATTHGRIYILNRDNAQEGTGHGSPLPTMMHGGPGRAGGGEELGGLKGLHFFLQKTAIQGSPDMLREVSKIHIPGATYHFTQVHPFQLHFEEIQVGDSLQTANRTITESDIVNFSNVSWDHFYAHTDTTSLTGTIFDRVVAHGYFLLSAAAGLFVSGKKGPVIANYGLEDASFFKPVYAGDTIGVFLTAKEKINRGVKGRNIPSGVVKWLVEVFNQRNELVCVATILTLVAKKSPFIELNSFTLKKVLASLSESSKPRWGLMSAQNMVEHLEHFLHLSVGKEIVDVKVDLNAQEQERLKDWLYKHKPISQGLKYPGLPLEANAPLKHKDLSAAKKSLLKSYEDFSIYYKELPEAQHAHPLFGPINKEMWELFHAKHFTYHFNQFGILD